MAPAQPEALSPRFPARRVTTAFWGNTTMGVILCSTHGRTSLVLACNHVCTSVRLGDYPPSYITLNLTLGDSERTESWTSLLFCVQCADAKALPADGTLISAHAQDADPAAYDSDTVQPLCSECLQQASGATSSRDGHEI
jgi:hypothetical protein